MVKAITCAKARAGYERGQVEGACCTKARDGLAQGEEAADVLVGRGGDQGAGPA